MAQTYDRLAEEIDRIVDSPYPTQLKVLRDLVCNERCLADVSRWLRSRPCQLQRLAQCLLDGLRHWPYVLDLITAFSHHVEARDALLRQEPCLLHDVVVQATKAQATWSSYTLAAVAMLSHPLPDFVAIPVEAQTLFVQLFEHAAEQPSLASMRPLYQVLSGTRAVLLGLLSDRTLLRFEEQLFNILRNVKGDNQPLSLYCLAIMKVMTDAVSEQSACGVSLSDTQELLANTTPTASRWRPEAIQQFFTGSKAQKTMQLLVLRTIWACTPSTGEHFDEKLESLTLANDVIAAVPGHLREEWRKANALVARKLEEKMIAVQLDVGLCLQAQCFLIRLHELGVVPDMVKQALRQIITDSEGLIRLINTRGHIHEACLVNARIFDQRTTTTFLQNIVDFAGSAAPDNILQSSRPLSEMLRHLSAATAYDEPIAEGVLLALDVLSCGRRLNSLSIPEIRQTASHRSRGKSGTCQQALTAARNALVVEICELFLRSAICSPHPTYAASQETVTLLLRLHTASVQSSPCSHLGQTIESRVEPINFVEATSTAQEAGLDWKQALHSELQARATTEQQSLVRMFTTACADLENRCENIEIPLNEEQQRKAALESTYQHLNEAYARLEAESIESSIRLHAIEEERDMALSELDGLREKAADLETDMNKLHRKLIASDLALQQARHQVTQDIEGVELKYATILAKKEEEVEDLWVRINDADDRAKSGAVEVEEIRKQCQQAQEDHDTIAAEVNDLIRANNERKLAVGQLTAQNGDLVDKKEQVDTLLQKARQELEREKTVRSTDIAELRAQHAQQVTSQVTDHEHHLRKLQQEHHEAMQAVKNQMHDALRELSKSREQHYAEMEAQQSTHEQQITEKQRRIDALRQTCVKKDKQITEANIMRSNLMTAMGIQAEETKLVLPHRPSRSSSTRTSVRGAQLPLDSSSMLFADDNAQSQAGDIGASFVSNASSAESRPEPTPKRAKPRTSCQAAPPVRARSATNLGTRSTRASTSRRVRQPLLSINGNRSAVKIVPSTAASKATVNVLDESTFVDSELITGTPGFGLAGTYAEDTNRDDGRGEDL